MEEELISFDTAKLAKEKGFDMYTGKAWIQKEKQEMFYTPKFTGISNGTVYHRPTQSLLQKWLRETHNLIVVSLPYTTSIENIEPCYIWMIYKKQASTATEDSIFKTYEEALEIALQETLKLI